MFLIPYTGIFVTERKTFAATLVNLPVGVCGENIMLNGAEIDVISTLDFLGRPSLRGSRECA